MSRFMSSFAARLSSSAAAAVLFSIAGATSLTPARLLAQDAGIAIGEMAPSAMVQRLDGTPVDMASFVGKKPVVIEFWATWCPLCKKLEPAMAAARAKYGDAVMFVGVGVPQNQTPARQQAYVTQQQMSGEYVFDADGAAYKAYKATHTSYVVVLDAKGMVVYTGAGGTQDIDSAVQKALPQPTKKGM
jgi:thiol-disulfide isomerase/thioredoxin